MAEVPNSSYGVDGVDTHNDLHVAAVVDQRNCVLGAESFATTRHGYRVMPACHLQRSRCGGDAFESQTVRFKVGNIPTEQNTYFPVNLDKLHNIYWTPIIYKFYKAAKYR